MGRGDLSPSNAIEAVCPNKFGSCLILRHCASLKYRNRTVTFSARRKQPETQRIYTIYYSLTQSCRAGVRALEGTLHPTMSAIEDIVSSYRLANAEYPRHGGG